jgi:putative acetyltransferase
LNKLQQAAFAIRALSADDDVAVRDIIRSVMPEFGAAGPGFAIHDAEVSAMHQANARPNCAYFVVEADGAVLGGGGVAPLDGSDGSVCELRKMYFMPNLRGRGAGRALIERCLRAARELGFRTCYLETLENMDAARALYEKVGFRRIPGPLGSTGHFSCDAFYLIEL